MNVQPTPKTKRKVCGVGINDSTTTINIRVTLPHPKGKQLQRAVWTCPFYVKWADMLKRCYSKKYLAKYPSYVGCHVCDEWLIFSNFRAWMEQQDWEGKELDKDLLVMGNKEYCPQRCIFITKKINYLFLTKPNKRGETLLGTRKTKSGKYQVACMAEGKSSNYGSHVCEMVAHTIWKQAKIKYLKEVMLNLEDCRISLGIQQRVDFLEESIINNTVVDSL